MILKGFKLMKKIDTKYISGDGKISPLIIEVTLIPEDFETLINFVVDRDGNISDLKYDNYIKYNGGWFRYINKVIV